MPRDAAALAWMANLGCLELHPHPVRAEDLDHPDELRVDLDPMPGIEWPQIVAVAREVRAVLDERALVGWPKTSGSRGIHVNVRIHRRWSFDQVRRAALALAREVERRAPGLATSKWWKEERHGVFLDYNQNAKDRTVASAYSVRPKPDGRVSAPVTWDELFEARPEDFTLRTMPARFAALGDRHAAIDGRPAPWTPSWSFRPARKRKASATRPGRRTTRSSGASRPASSPRRGRTERSPPAGACPASRSSRSRAPPRRKMRSPGSIAGRRATRGRRPPRDGGRARGRDARTFLHVDPRPRQPRARAGIRAAGPGAPGPRLRPVARVHVPTGGEASTSPTQSVRWHVSCSDSPCGIRPAAEGGPDDLCPSRMSLPRSGHRARRKEILLRGMRRPGEPADGRRLPVRPRDLRLKIHRRSHHVPFPNPEPYPPPYDPPRPNPDPAPAPAPKPDPDPRRRPGGPACPSESNGCVKIAPIVHPRGTWDRLAS